MINPYWLFRMMRFLTLLLMFSLAWYSLQAQKVHYFQFRIADADELRSITRMISIDDVRGKVVYAYATGEQMEQFVEKTSYDVQHLPITGLKNQKPTSVASELSEWDAYPTYEQYEAMMDSMASAHPAICDLDTIGYS